MADVEIRLLGPVEALLDGAPVQLGGVKQRVALAVLALEAGRIVPAEQLIDALWGEAPPATAATALQGHVSRLRRLLGPEVIATRAPGYALELEPEAVDLTRFERLLTAPPGETNEVQRERLTTALAFWRGAALADLASEPGLAAAARRLDELRLAARLDLVDAELELGRHAELVPQLEVLAEADPPAERPVSQLMIALYRSGRPGDALTTYRGFRAHLRERLGLDPSAELRELERRVLTQDPALAPPASQAAASSTPLRIPVTVVAVSLHTEALDPEVYGRVVGEAREAVRLVLERHGASVQPSAGTVLVGMFGVPAPHEDDAARALQATREAVEAVAGFELVVRAGVASGEAFAGESPATASALALAASARSGAAVDDLTRTRARGRRLRIGLPLAGREAEHELLRAAFEATVLEGRSRLIGITGPAGIGKSRLVADLLGPIGEEARVLLVRCLSYGDGVTLLPAIDLVRGAAEVAATATTAQASARFAELLADDPRGNVAAEQLVRLLGLTDEPPDDDSMWAIRRLLVLLARERPLVVVIDDLHWAAPPIVELVRQLAQPAYAPLLVVTTARATETTTIGERLQLAPLGRAACEVLVETMLEGAHLDGETLDALVEASGGNPLFLEELVLSLHDGALAAPPSLESLLATRLARLPEGERDVIGSAAVIGRSLSIAALRDLVEAPVDDAAARAVDDGILQPTRAEGQDLEFRHLLLRDAAYASLPLSRRAELHERHARWLDRSQEIPPLESEALVVYHLDQAFRARETLDAADARLPVDAPVIAARAAALGRVLLARGDAGAAAGLFVRSLELRASDLVAVDLGRAQLDIGEFEAAASAFAAASGPRARLGSIDVRLRIEPGTDVAAVAADVAEIREELEHNADQVGLTEALLTTAYLDVVRGDAASLTRNLGEALRFARRAGQSRAEGWILFLLCSACWYGPLPLAEGIERCERVRDEASGRPTVEASALQSLAVLRAMSGRFDEARDLVATSRTTRREIGQVVGAAASAIDEGTIELLAGDPEAAVRTLREGTAELERLGEKGYYSTAAAMLAEALQALGEKDEARRLVRAVEQAAAPDDVVSQVGWRAVEARLLASTEVTAATALAREATILAGETDFPLLRAQAWAALADVLGDETVRQTARLQLEPKGCAPVAVENWVSPRL